MDTKEQDGTLRADFQFDLSTDYRELWFSEATRNMLGLLDTRTATAQDRAKCYKQSKLIYELSEAITTFITECRKLNAPVAQPVEAAASNTAQ